MVVTGTDGGALDAAAINYETGQEVPLGWLPADAASAGLKVYGFYGGNVWVTVQGEPEVLTIAGEEVPEASGWVTFPTYAGGGLGRPGHPGGS